MKEIYTSEQWAKDGTFKAVAGQEITEEIYNQMFNVLPPQRLKEVAFGCVAGFRTTEPYTHDENGKALYMAFGKNHGKYYYLGLQ